MWDFNRTIKGNKDGEICIGWAGGGGGCTFKLVIVSGIKSLGEGDMVWKTKRPDFFFF